MYLSYFTFTVLCCINFLDTPYIVKADFTALHFTFNGFCKSITLSMLMSGVSIISITIFLLKNISGYISPPPMFFLLRDIVNTSLICSIGFMKKSLSSYLTLMISMCYSRLSSEIITFNNLTCQQNVLSLSKIKSSTFWPPSTNISSYYIFVIVGLDLLMFHGNKCVRSALSRIFIFSPLPLYCFF